MGGPYRTATQALVPVTKGRTWRGRLRSWLRRWRLFWSLRNAHRVRFEQVRLNGQPYRLRAELRIMTNRPARIELWFEDYGTWRSVTGEPAPYTKALWLTDCMEIYQWRERNGLPTHHWIRHPRNPQ